MTPPTPHLLSVAAAVRRQGLTASLAPLAPCGGDARPPLPGLTAIGSGAGVWPGSRLISRRLDHRGPRSLPLKSTLRRVEDLFPIRTNRFDLKHGYRHAEHFFDRNSPTRQVSINCQFWPAHAGASLDGSEVPFRRSGRPGANESR
jgi:hypothetical protein